MKSGLVPAPFQLPAAHKSREVSLELLREASQLGVNLYEEHQRFVKSFDPRWRTDEQVRNKKYVFGSTIL